MSLQFFLLEDEHGLAAAAICELLAASAVYNPFDILLFGGASRIARNLGDRGGDASLVLGLKFQGRGNGARLLPRQYHIILELDVDRKKIQGHGNYTNTTQSLPPKPLHHPARG